MRAATVDQPGAIDAVALLVEPVDAELAILLRLWTSLSAEARAAIVRLASVAVN
ncbi:hypothetical protein OAS39_00615 [Pirellulales bacterium]|nr:hypothetical protein [Pirellulales bacterium]